jgi:hypothetical protein
MNPPSARPHRRALLFPGVNTTIHDIRDDKMSCQTDVSAPKPGKGRHELAFSVTFCRV